MTKSKKVTGRISAKLRREYLDLPKTATDQECRDRAIALLGELQLVCEVTIPKVQQILRRRFRRASKASLLTPARIVVEQNPEIAQLKYLFIRLSRA